MATLLFDNKCFDGEPTCRTRVPTLSPSVPSLSPSVSPSESPSTPSLSPSDASEAPSVPSLVPSDPSIIASTLAPTSSELNEVLMEPLIPVGITILVTLLMMYCMRGNCGQREEDNRVYPLDDDDFDW